MIKAAGYQQAFLVFGLIQGGIVILMSWGLQVAPPALLASKVKADQTDQEAESNVGRAKVLCRC